jgi:DNA polymerase-4
MRRAGKVGRTITLKIRYADFTTFTRRTTLPLPTDTAAHLAAVAIAIFENNYRGDRKLRLLGISVSRLAEREAAPGAVQHELFPSHCAQPLVDSPTDDILDVLRDRFGERIIEVACTRSRATKGSSANLNA